MVGLTGPGVCYMIGVQVFCWQRAGPAAGTAGAAIRRPAATEQRFRLYIALVVLDSTRRNHAT